MTDIACVTGGPSGCSGTGSIENAEGLANPAGIAISPDGLSVYVTDQGDNSITTFNRDPTTGLLTEQNNSCYATNVVTGCTSDPGLNTPSGVVVSADGRNVYVSAYSGQDVAEFGRSTNGTLSLITGNACISDGNNPNGCPVAESADGLLNVVGVDAYGADVYATAGGTQGNGDIAEFVRDSTTGALSPISGNACTGSATAPSGCLTSATAINGTEDMTINSAGTFAYVNSFDDDAVVELSRNASTGALSQIGCVETGNGPAVGCGTTNALGIDAPLGVALSPDGTNLYVSSSGDQAEAAFAVNSTTGLITQLGTPYNCVTSNSSGCGTNDATGLNSARRVVVSPDGKNVYVADQGGDGIAELARTVPSSPPPPPPKGQITNGGEASWDTSTTASSASVTVTVPAVSCGSVKAGTFAGQAAGVELYGQVTISGTTYYPAEVADARTYCDGPKAEYETSFVVNNESNGTRVVHPAGLTVSPGDPLAISTTATSSSASMKMTDLNTGKSASITGPGFVAADGSDIGVEPIASNGHGAPILSGSQSATATTVTLGEPVQSSPVVFQDATVDGQPISAPSSLYGLRWVNGSNAVVASPSALSGGDFAVDFASVPTPVPAKSGDAAPVSGKVLIELPGTRKFVPLNSVKQIPNGTLVNATNGSVQITVKLPNGQTQTGVFFGGEFQFEQSKSGEVTAVLAGSSFKRCPKPVPAKKTKPKKKEEGARRERRLVQQASPGPPSVVERARQLLDPGQVRSRVGARDRVADPGPVQRHLLQGDARRDHGHELQAAQPQDDHQAGAQLPVAGVERRLATTMSFDVGPVPREVGRTLGLAGVMGALLLLCAFAGPAFATGGPGWLSPVKLSVDGSDAQTPVIAMDGNGDSDAVWGLASGTLQTSYRQAGPGDPFVEQDVGGSSSSTVPDVSEDGSGDGEAVWIQGTSLNWSYRTNDVDGFGGASGINNDTCPGAESDPRVAVDSNANVIAAYLCDNGGTQDVEAVYAAGGTAGNFNTAPANPDNGPPSNIFSGANSASNIQIAEDPAGDAILVWQEQHGGIDTIWYAYRPNGNTSTGRPLRP